MEGLYACCCGIDVHAKMLVTCVLKQGQKEVRTFATMTEDLLRLLDWLTQAGGTQVRMERNLLRTYTDIMRMAWAKRK